MKFRVIMVRVFFAIGVVLTAATAFSAVDEAIKPVTVITGDEFMGNLKSPEAVFFDEVKKRLYIADTANSRLVSLDSGFEYLSELSHSNFILPRSVVKTREGLFFIVDAEKGEIVLIDLGNDLVELFELKGLPPGREGYLPGKLALDAEGRLYVTDRLSGNILVSDKAGNIVKEIEVKEEGFFGFTDVRVDDNGNVYALDTVGGKVYVFGSGGDLVSKFGKKGDIKGEFRFPTSLAVDSKGLIYVLDRHAGNVLVFNRSGGMQFTIATPGSKEGQLDNPSYIFIDDEDRIYTIDGGRIQVFQMKAE